MGIKKYKLGEIADITTGYPFDGHKYTKQGTRVVRGENIGAGFLHWEDRVDKRWNDSLSGLDRYWLYTGDIVMQMDGNIGKNIATIETSMPMLIAQRVACIRAKRGYSQTYIYGILRSKAFYDYITQCTTGTSIQHVSLRQIADFSFPFHNQIEQHHIGALLATFDRKILLNRAINQNLRARRVQRESRLSLCRAAAVNADVSPNLAIPGRSSGGAEVRCAA